MEIMSAQICWHADDGGVSPEASPADRVSQLSDKSKRKGDRLDMMSG